MALQIRRGTNAERLTITPLQGELIFTTDTKKVFIGDGTTLGGVSISTDTNSEDVQDIAGAMFTGGTHSGISFSYNDGNGTINATVTGGGGGGSGTVTSVSVASANGFAGTVSNPTTTPSITLSTSVSGVLKGNGTAISAAVAGTDYQAPISLTTTGSSGPATLVGNVLNIPEYAGGGGGGATYTVSAETATGGANITLTGSDASTDSVKLAEGSNITITRTDADTITISSSAAVALDDLTDVTLTAPLVDGQILRYDSIAGEWANQDLEGNSYKLSITADDNSSMVDHLTKAITASTVDAAVLTSASGLITVNDNMTVSEELRVFTETSTRRLATFNQAHNDSGSGSAFVLRRSRGTDSVGTSIVSGDYVGNIEFRGLVNSTTATLGAIRVKSTGTLQPTYSPGIMEFFITGSASATPLRVADFESDGSFNLYSGSSTAPPMKVTVAHDATGDTDGMVFRRARGTVDSPAIIQTNDVINSIFFSGYDGATYRGTARIRARVTGTPAAGDIKSRLDFSVRNADNTFTINQLVVLEKKVSFNSMPQMPTYANEAAADASIGGAASRVNGMFYYDTALSKIRGVAGGVWVDLH